MWENESLILVHANIIEFSLLSFPPSRYFNYKYPTTVLLDLSHCYGPYNLKKAKEI